MKPINLQNKFELKINKIIQFIALIQCLYIVKNKINPNHISFIESKYPEGKYSSLLTRIFIVSLHN